MNVITEYTRNSVCAPRPKTNIGYKNLKIYIYKADLYVRLPFVITVKEQADYGG